jgi:transposase
LNDDQDIKDILKEILKWTKFEGMQKVKQVLESTLDNDDKKLIYDLSDGRSSSKIARIAGVSGQTVRNYWKEWAVLGIVEFCPEHKKRYHRIFSLKEVGIEIPEVRGSVETREEAVEGAESE